MFRICSREIYGFLRGIKCSVYEDSDKELYRLETDYILCRKWRIGDLATV